MKMANAWEGNVPQWAGIYFGMIESLLEIFDDELQEWSTEIELWLARNKEDEDGYLIKWGNSGWSYVITGPTNLVVYEGKTKADMQPHFDDERRNLTSFLVNATMEYIRTGTPLHRHCSECEEGKNHADLY